MDAGPRHYTYLDEVEVPEPSNMFDNYGGGRNSSLKTQHMDLETYLSLQTDVSDTTICNKYSKEIKDSVVQKPSCDKSTIWEFDRMTMEQRKAWDAYYVPRNENSNR